MLLCSLGLVTRHQWDATERERRERRTEGGEGKRAGGREKERMGNQLRWSSDHGIVCLTNRIIMVNTLVIHPQSKAKEEQCGRKILIYSLTASHTHTHRGRPHKVNEIEKEKDTCSDVQNHTITDSVHTQGDK